MILLVDGGNLVHRVRHTFNLSYAGQDTSVSYGSLRVLSSVMERYQPNVVVFCWDAGVPAYRYRLCKTYKNRTHEDDPTYPDFLRQLSELRQVLPMFGIVSAFRKQIEADDLIGQAVQMLEGEKVIMTTDHDLYQCIERKSSVVVYDPLKDREITPKNFQEVTDGVDVGDWLLYRALVGDSSDGIPGCQGIGHKTALELVGQYCGFVSMLREADNKDSKMRPAVANKLKAYGMDGFADTIRVMRLDLDISGARTTLIEAIQNRKPFDKDACRTFLGKRGMVSLMEPTFYSMFKALEDPAGYLVDVEALRYPRIAPERKYYETA